VLGPVRPETTTHEAWRPAARDRSTGPWPNGPVSLRRRHGARERARAHGAAATRSLRVTARCRAHRRKEGMVGSPRKRLDGWGGAEAARWCSRVAEALQRSVGVSSSSCSTVHRGEVRNERGFGRRTRGGGAHREAAAAAATVPQQAARRGRGVDTGADERSKARGGMDQGALRGKSRGGDETGVVASGGAPFK
jgi:hypothetical protein